MRDSVQAFLSSWTAGDLAEDQQLSVIFENSTAVYSVEQREIHPEFVWGVDFGVDLALLRLNRTVDGVSPAQPYRGPTGTS